MIVVADSSPLHYLILLDQSDLLHRFYGEVLVPDPVAAELGAPASPPRVREWMRDRPSWLQVVRVSAEDVASITDELGLGERAAIALALRARADLLLIDDSEARAEAARRSLPVTGTLAVLRTAAEEGLIDVRDMLAKLTETNFYVDEKLLSKIFGRWQ